MKQVVFFTFCISLLWSGSAQALTVTYFGDNTLASKGIDSPSVAKTNFINDITGLNADYGVEDFSALENEVLNFGNGIKATGSVGKRTSTSLGWSNYAKDLVTFSIVITNELQPTLKGAVALAVSASQRMPTDQPWCAIQTSC